MNHRSTPTVWGSEKVKGGERTRRGNIKSIVASKKST